MGNSFYEKANKERGRESFCSSRSRKQSCWEVLSNIINVNKLNKEISFGNQTDYIMFFFFSGLNLFLIWFISVEIYCTGHLAWFSYLTSVFHKSLAFSFDLVDQAAESVDLKITSSREFV